MINWSGYIGHGAILAGIVALWRKMDKHVKEFRLKMNGYTLEKKDEGK